MKEKKLVNLRLPIYLWEFIRKQAFDKKVSIHSIILERLEKYKKKCEEGVDI